MKKLLVPTDFSDTSKNAALFAVQMAADIQNAKIILIHVSDKITGGSDGSPLTEDDDDRRIILSQALGQLKEELLAVSQAPIEFAMEKGSSLVETLTRYVRHQAIDMVIMGITGATRLEQIFMGSNTLEMAKEGVCPVLIVPPDAKYRTIKNVVLASDFKEVETTIPVAPLKATLDLFKPNLHIVNVDSEHYVELTDEYKAERKKLETMFSDYKPEFSFIRQYDFFDAISQFVDDRNIDLILIVPKDRSFVPSLFKTSHTKKLAYHSHVPIVAIHE
ncbi:MULTISPECIES: universal stress protein [Niastella]|uniref:Universal stress protein n=1 Tax=Niastella soli TaxID=2821487 RepID=A0ABS3YXS1_9BACT|nr:universal stress protein [Niastella soli]MBO9202731.1 universal stress protein [Niastella soli]